MAATLHLLNAVLISVLLSLVVVRVLSRPLAPLLARLCPDEPSAAFWLRYIQLMLTLAPLVGALWIDRLASDAAPLEAFRLTLMASLVGLLIGLYAVGRRLGRFVVTPSRRGQA